MDLPDPYGADLLRAHVGALQVLQGLPHQAVGSVDDDLRCRLVDDEDADVHFVSVVDEAFFHLVWGDAHPVEIGHL